MNGIVAMIATAVTGESTRSGIARFTTAQRMLTQSGIDVTITAGTATTITITGACITSWGSGTGTITGTVAATENATNGVEPQFYGIAVRPYS